MYEDEKDWFYCKTEEEAKELLKKHEDFNLVQYTLVDWTGPGNYYVRYTATPCGRGCCYDEGLTLTHVREIFDSLEKQYEDLKRSLDFVRKKL